LLPKVMTTADLLLQEYAPHVDPIIQRWLGKTENYGNV